jgi:hypothetical protein
MFWTAILAFGLAMTFVKLGAASVTVSILGMALQASAVVIGLLVALMIWNKHFKNQT